MIKPDILDALVAAGATADMIVAAIKADAREDEAKRDRRRQSDRERQRRFRERHAESHTNGRDVSVTERDLPPKKVSPTPPSKNNPPLVSADADTVGGSFEEFKSVYPKREGSNPWKPARQAFERIVRKGMDGKAIIAAAKKLAAENPEPTRFIPQAVTWLNQERFADLLSGPDPPQRGRTAEEYAVEWRAKRAAEQAGN